MWVAFLVFSYYENEDRFDKKSFAQKLYCDWRSVTITLEKIVCTHHEAGNKIVIGSIWTFYRNLKTNLTFLKFTSLYPTHKKIVKTYRVKKTVTVLHYCQFFLSLSELVYLTLNNRRKKSFAETQKREYGKSFDCVGKSASLERFE